MNNPQSQRPNNEIDWQCLCTTQYSRWSWLLATHESHCRIFCLRPTHILIRYVSPSLSEHPLRVKVKFWYFVLLYKTIWLCLWDHRKIYVVSVFNLFDKNVKLKKLNLNFDRRHKPKHCLNLVYFGQSIGVRLRFHPHHSVVTQFQVLGVVAVLSYSLVTVQSKWAARGSSGVYCIVVKMFASINGW